MPALKRFLHRLLIPFAAIIAAPAQADSIAELQPIGRIEKVAEIRGAMPCGVAVSASGRIFINYPRWGDNVRFTVAEIKNGQPVAFPNTTINQLADQKTQASKIVSAQSVVIDPSGQNLWVVDTGSIRPTPVSYGGPKLIEIDLRSNRVKRTIPISKEALEPETYLNDVRFAMNLGKDGYAFISDSSANGGIIVVDLSTGENWRRLGKTRFTMSDPDFYPVVEAQILMIRKTKQKPERFNVGSDGIAVSSDGKNVYFRSLTSRHLYSIETEALVNRNLDEKALESMVVDHGQIAGASDGLEADQDGGIFLSDYEHNAIHRFNGSIETMQTIMYSPAAIWPDSLSLADDGNLYFTANQLNRQAQFHNGIDKRIQPYVIYRVKTDHLPIRKRPAQMATNGGQQ